MKATIQADTVSGEYYGIVYKGNPLFPIFLVVMLTVAFWWLIRRRNRKT
ncbi:hypothetical protein [Larkinella ripae]